ncbi:SPOR domain-containing protein [Aureisphaera galaxeae]|uniref:SPOR domain-containing protein n=1 Tax=Aureisphaera galaxeae TaxID=1538023 RepID=UPI0023501DC1|nr:SPOR domain-containing protein [Aureisphaera galaxeae]MDC8005820.1 SPOR domain-containing protein [Aureisphaera galaxeae]
MSVFRNPNKYLFFTLFAVVFSFSTLAQTATVTVNQDEKIPELLELKKDMEKDNELSDGYTIQIYSGSLRGANATISKYRNKYAQWPASIEYETPNYKVWVGNYNSRIQADRALLEIHRNFPNALKLPRKQQK